MNGLLTVRFPYVCQHCSNTIMVKFVLINYHNRCHLIDRQTIGSDFQVNF